MIPNLHNRGFTLVELMVVIAIIGMLSSVTLAALSKTRLKARDGKIIAQVHQLRSMLELERVDNNSYANLVTNNWVTEIVTCNSSFGSSAYVTKVREICTEIVNSSADATFPGTGRRLYIGANPVSYSSANTYSIMAYLPGAQVVYCIGSSGRSSRTTIATPYNQAGCWDNP